MPIAVKLFFLAVRQASKPMANGLKRAAQSSDLFTAALAATGRTMHRVSLQVTRAAEGKEQLARVVQLAEKNAIQKGADLLSEFFIYSVAGATVYYEWNLQRREKLEKAEKEAAAEAARREEMRRNEERQWDEFRHLNQRITLLQEELQELRTRQLPQVELADGKHRASKVSWWNPWAGRSSGS